MKGSGANHYPRAPALVPTGDYICPRRHRVSARCWFNVGPPSSTLAQYCPDSGSVLVIAGMNINVDLEIFAFSDFSEFVIFRPFAKCRIREFSR